MITVIVDCGGTKGEWVLLDKGGVRTRFKTDGFNAATADISVLESLITSRLLPVLDKPGNIVETICFYGAGCKGVFAEKVAAALHRFFPKACVTVESDMLGAARALCGTAEGIVGILGTGSNTCLYDGEKIVDNVPPLGFILGDEGSGAALGKSLLADVFRGILPDDVCGLFHERYHLSQADIVRRVYREQAPNSFLASFAPFLKENISVPGIHSLVLENFIRFFRRNIMLYPGYKDIQVSFTGSVACHFSETLLEAAALSGCAVSHIEPSPMQGLIRYHEVTI